MANSIVFHLKLTSSKAVNKRPIRRSRIVAPIVLMFMLSSCVGQIDGIPNRPFDDDGLKTAKFAFDDAEHKKYRVANGSVKLQLHNKDYWSLTKKLRKTLISKFEHDFTDHMPIWVRLPKP